MTFSRRLSGIRPDHLGPLAKRIFGRDEVAPFGACRVNIQLSTPDQEHPAMPHLPEHIIDVRKWAIAQAREEVGAGRLQQSELIVRARGLEAYVLGTEAVKDGEASATAETTIPADSTSLWRVLVILGFCETLQQALSLIRGGSVMVNEGLVLNHEFRASPGDRVSISATLPAV